VTPSRKSDFGLALEPARETEAGIGRSPNAGSGAGRVDLDSRALCTLSEEISRDYAPHLEHTALVLYDRDPEHLQAQWYVTPEELAQARCLFHEQAASARQVLRLRRLTRDGKAEVVASVPRPKAESKRDGQESFALQGDGAEYECELGLESDTGGWLLLARSNRITLPVGSPPSSSNPPTPGNSRIRESSQGGGIQGPSEPQDVPVEAALAAVGKPLYPVFPNLELKPEDSQARPRPSPSGETASGTEARGGNAESRDGAVPQSWLDGQTAASAPPVMGLEAMPPPLLPSTPDRERPPELAGKLYDPRAALSSATPRGGQSGRLELEIHAELIVEGRASPGSTVELFGHIVPTGEDGRFFIRRPVEDPLLLSLAIVHPPVQGAGELEPE
jgi:hypothetical protein